MGRICNKFFGTTLQNCYKPDFQHTGGPGGQIADYTVFFTTRITDGALIHPKQFFLYFSSLFHEATRWMGWEQVGGLATTGEECRDVTASAPPPSSARQRRPARVGAGHCRHICICAKFATFFWKTECFWYFSCFF